MYAVTDFTLRLNGAKTVLLPQTPGIVVGTLQYPDWRQSRESSGKVGIDGGGDGGPGRNPVPKFPGDPTATPRRRLPTDQNEPERQPATLSEQVEHASLPEGPTHSPQKGLLFFPYKGKLTKVRQVELIYAPPEAEPVTLVLP